MTQTENKKVIAFFDFDGTITSKDSLGAFLVYNFGVIKCGLIYIIYSPVHLLFKLQFIGSTTAKNFLLPFFFKNISINRFEKMCTDFCEHKLPGMIYAKASEQIQWHQKEEHEIVIVSASVYDWIEPWAKSVAIKKLITSKLEIINNKLTGKLAGKNCNDEEKVVRIKKEIPDIDDYEIWAYGNSKSDRFMLAIADKSFYKKFESS